MKPRKNIKEGFLKERTNRTIKYCVYDPGEEENTESSFIPRTLAIQDESCEGLRNSKLTQYSFWSIGTNVRR